LIVSHSAAVSYNSDRQSLQLYCASGKLVANLPLADAQVAGLAEAIAVAGAAKDKQYR
jgi:hypothetical protein